MNRELKLRFYKALVNVPVRLADRLLPFPDARYRQTQIMLNVYGKMMQAYRLECLQGTFGVCPDGNFERLLRVSAKVLSYVSESDRYYRAWLGLAALLVHEQMEKFDLSFEEIVEQCREQWLIDFSFLPRSYVESCKAEFLEMTLCDYLGNLARMETGKIPLPRNVN